MSVEILVLCPAGLDGGLLSKAVSLHSGRPVRALVPQANAEDAAALGAGLIHTLDAGFAADDDTVFAQWLEEKIRVWGSGIVLAPATVQMRNVMPILAWRLQAGLTADCTELSMEGDALLQTRPAFGNSLMADIRSLSPVQMATVRPSTFRAVPAPCPDPRVIPEQAAGCGGRLTLQSFTPFADGTPLSQAQIIVAGGMGVGSREGFSKLEKLAAALGGAVGASRSAVDAGLAPYRCQIGMTGITVCPRLYIAVGISGAVQHLAGMSGADTVIAINSDPKAPIFDYADYGVVGDWETVINKLLEELS